MQYHIKGPRVLLPDGSVTEQDIYIADGVIAGIGAEPADFSADRVLDGSQALAMPGLINCHTHAYMTIFRNYADDLMFHEWLFGRISPAEDRMTPEQAYWCNLLACMEMIRSGTTCFLDMHMFKHQCLKAAGEAGMRAVLSRGLVGESSRDPGGLMRLEEAFEEMEAAKRDSRFSFRLAPHAIYTCGTDYLEHLVAVAREKGLGFHTHIAETQKEYDDCMAAHGRTPVEYLDGLGLLEQPTVAAHCVYVTDRDIEILAARKVSVATNPVSNMKLGNGFAPVTKLLRAGVNVCVGTDSVASNNRLNLFTELAMLAYVHKGLDRDAQSVTARQALAIGTSNGARALGLEDVTGSIEVGKRADLLLIDLNRPQFKPENNLAAGLIYSANGSEVDTVFIDGEIVMERGRLKTIDEEKVTAEVERIRRELL